MFLTKRRSSPRFKLVVLNKLSTGEGTRAAPNGKPIACSFVLLFAGAL